MIDPKKSTLAMLPTKIGKCSNIVNSIEEIKSRQSELLSMSEGEVLSASLKLEQKMLSQVLQYLDEDIVES